MDHEEETDDGIRCKICGEITSYYGGYCGEQLMICGCSCSKEQILLWGINKKLDILINLVTI